MLKKDLEEMLGDMKAQNKLLQTALELALNNAPTAGAGVNYGPSNLAAAVAQFEDDNDPVGNKSVDEATQRLQRRIDWDLSDGGMLEEGQDVPEGVIFLSDYFVKAENGA